MDGMRSRADSLAAMVEHVSKLENVEAVFEVVRAEEERPSPRPDVLRACARKAAALIPAERLTA